MSREKGIRLSPKYGANPTICSCFFCGKPKNEIALVGKVGRGKTDIEMPMYSIMDYEPCDECRDNMSKGVTLIECTLEKPYEGCPPIQGKGDDSLYPTGTWVVLTEEVTKRLFNADDDSPIIKHKKAFIEKGVLQKMGLLDSLNS